MLVNTIIYFIKRKILPGYKVGKNDLVIDIGSGDKPFWRGNIFFDNLSLDNLQRNTHEKTIDTIGKFVNGDITNTNFKDKAFDFSFCSHVLEHVKRPDLAIEEIMRISKAGYIEVPNGILEYIKPFSSHLWFVFPHNNKLIFFRKGGKLHSVLTENSNNYSFLLNKIKNPFIRFYWKDKIDYEIVDMGSSFKGFIPPSIKTVKPGEDLDNSILLILSKKWYMFAVKIMRKIHGVDRNFSIKSLLKK